MPFTCTNALNIVLNFCKQDCKDYFYMGIAEWIKIQHVRWWWIKYQSNLSQIVVWTYIHLDFSTICASHYYHGRKFPHKTNFINIIWLKTKIHKYWCLTKHGPCNFRATCIKFGFCCIDPRPTAESSQAHKRTCGAFLFLVQDSALLDAVH